jgi:hypothetical protein
MNYFLIISPEKSNNYAWQFLDFEAEKQAHDEVVKRNLNCEHYIMHKDALVNIIRNWVQHGSKPV